MKKNVSIILFLFLTVVLTASSARKISMEELENKIAGAWIGQMIGNMYGLPFENKFIDNPGPETWPYGYTKSIPKMQQVDGAFSDDDTDFEYLYLLLMEKVGCEPTYEELRQTWLYHVRDRVWLANRAALGLMHHGFTPPFTGKKEINPHWFQIDPQLINEIWAYTAPGMVQYAAQKSEWAALITSDSWAAHPTMHYGAMYAEAFFEEDIEKLVVKALSCLPADSRYRETVNDMIALWKRYPNDWKKARQEMAQKYYVQEPAMIKTIWNANINGACGILSFLYGNGDFQKTMDLGCAMGFDADNQTATIGGILGVMYGFDALPKEMYLPFKEWTKPFNNRYINVTRYDVPDAAIDDMIGRTVQQAVDVVVSKGGKVIENSKGRYLVINEKAKFQAPLEFYIGPSPRIEAGIPFEYEYYFSSNKDYIWTLKSGTLPQGVVFDKGKISGAATQPGVYSFALSLSDGKKSIDRSVELIVRSKNIAPHAAKIIANIEKVNFGVLDSCWYTFGKPMYAESVSVINDGRLTGEGSVFYTLAACSNLPKIDYIGYEWNEERSIAALALHIGCMEEFGGWFSDLNIQYKDKEGKWRAVPAFQSVPALPATDTVFFQPHFVEYYLTFAPVRTQAIRILADASLLQHWHKYTKKVSSFISVTELSVYEK